MIGITVAQWVIGMDIVAILVSSVTLVFAVTWWRKETRR